jgi:hypothetical protein
MHNVTPDILAEYIPLWMVIDGISFEPTDPRPDEIVWTRTASGEYTTSSAYQMQFQGSVESNFKALIWQVWAPSRCKFFCLVNASESSMDSRQVSPTPMAKWIFLPALHHPQPEDDQTLAEGVPVDAVHLGKDQWMGLAAAPATMEWGEHVSYMVRQPFSGSAGIEG